MTQEETRSDLELVDAVNRGDVRAFEAIYLRYRDWVVALAFRFCGHRDDALDVLQETFTYLLRKFPGFTLTAAMKTFLYPAVRNLSIAAARKRRRTVVDDRILEDVPARAEPDETSREELDVVLRTLAPIHREVVLMRFVDDMSLQEIADALDVPLGTVKSRLHHALTGLREDPRTRDYFK